MFKVHMSASSPSRYPFEPDDPYGVYLSNSLISCSNLHFEFDGPIDHDIRIDRCKFYDIKFQCPRELVSMTDMAVNQSGMSGGSLVVAHPSGAQISLNNKNYPVALDLFHKYYIRDDPWVGFNFIDILSETILMIKYKASVYYEKCKFCGKSELNSKSVQVCDGDAPHEDINLCSKCYGNLQHIWERGYANMSLYDFVTKTL